MWLDSKSRLVRIWAMGVADKSGTAVPDESWPLCVLLPSSPLTTTNAFASLSFSLRSFAFAFVLAA